MEPFGNILIRNMLIIDARLGIYRTPKVLKFSSEAKLEQIIAIVATRSISCFFSFVDV